MITPKAAIKSVLIQPATNAIAPIITSLVRWFSRSFFACTKKLSERLCLAEQVERAASAQQVKYLCRYFRKLCWVFVGKKEIIKRDYESKNQLLNPARANLPGSLVAKNAIRIYASGHKLKKNNNHDPPTEKQEYVIKRFCQEIHRYIPIAEVKDSFPGYASLNIFKLDACQERVNIYVAWVRRKILSHLEKALGCQAHKRVTSAYATP